MCSELDNWQRTGDFFCRVELSWVKLSWVESGQAMFRTLRSIPTQQTCSLCGWQIEMDRTTKFGRKIRPNVWHSFGEPIPKPSASAECHNLTFGPSILAYVTVRHIPRVLSWTWSRWFSREKTRQQQREPYWQQPADWTVHRSVSVDRQPMSRRETGATAQHWPGELPSHSDDTVYTNCILSAPILIPLRA